MTDEEIMEAAAEWFVTGENQRRGDDYLYRSLGTPYNVFGRDLIGFARAVRAFDAPLRMLTGAETVAASAQWNPSQEGFYEVLQRKFCEVNGLTLVEKPGNTICNPHPDAPHGFNRNASHNAGRYVCHCEGWVPALSRRDGAESGGTTGGGEKT